MTLVLEAIALAGRAYAMDETPGMEPWGNATIYYMTPQNPNCVVDIFDAWETKCAAMDALESQLLVFWERGKETPEQLKLRKAMVPNWEELDTDLERGKLYKREMDKAFYMYPSSTGHCKALYAEPYRREGVFILGSLPV
jgi:LmbE family N-acetylglucosaminyl deacetylase